MTEETNLADEVEEALSEAERAIEGIPEIDRQIGILLARRQLAFEKAYGAFAEKAFDWRRLLGCAPSELIREWDEKGVESAKFRKAVAGVRETFFPPGSPAAEYSFVGFRHDAYDRPLEFAFRRIGGNAFEKFVVRLLTRDDMQPAKAQTLVRLPPGVWVTGATTGPLSCMSYADYGATASWKEARDDVGNYARAAAAADPDDYLFLMRLGSALRDQEQDRVMHGRNGCDLFQKVRTYQTVCAAARNFDLGALQTIENCLNLRRKNDRDDRGWSVQETSNDGVCARYEVIRQRVPDSAFMKTEEWSRMSLSHEKRLSVRSGSDTDTRPR